MQIRKKIKKKLRKGLKFLRKWLMNKKKGLQLETRIMKNLEKL